MKSLIVLGILCTVALSAPAQNRLEGKITYISGDVVYTSLGRGSGIQDSTLVYVMRGNDTTSVLVVIAVSSSSSACRSIRPGRAYAVGDRVLAIVHAATTEQPPTAAGIAVADTSVVLAPATDLTREIGEQQSSFRLRGSVGVQYYGAVYSSPSDRQAQPALSVNLRGSGSDSPLSFQVRGLLRSYVRGTLSPVAHASVNRSRLHRLSVDYDDGMYRLSIGRVPPSPFIGLGYIDGFYGAITSGIFSGGVAAGLEPGYGQTIVSTERRKGALFFGVATEDRTTFTATAGYSRTYLRSDLDRESAGLLISSRPSENLSVYAQTEVDFRSASNHRETYAIRLTSLYGTIHYRPMEMLTIGAGVTSWRPLYTLQTALALADSLIDEDLRTNPFVSTMIYLPERIMLSGQISPRTSSRGFGKEYLLSTSCSAADIARTAFTLRATAFRNLSGYSRTDGISVGIQRTIASLVDITGRFQWTGTLPTASGERTDGRSFGLDLSLPIADHLSFWGSLEHAMTSGSRSTFFLTEISWRF